MRIVFIGAGNMASSLAPALQKNGEEIIQVYSRTEESATQLASALGCEHTTCLEHICPEADIYIYALRDEVYLKTDIFEQIHSKADSLHILTGASIDINIISKAHQAVLYPFQTFSKQHPICDFSRIPILIEASDDYSLNTVEKLARTLTGHVYHSTLETRTHLHIAGVIANNFCNYMYQLASEQLQKAELPFSVLLPLIDETASKVHAISPREAQTGPAIRHDKTTINQHLSMLDEKTKIIYACISSQIENL